MTAKCTPTSKNKDKKATTYYIDYEAKLDDDDSGDKDLTVVGTSYGMLSSLPI